MKVKIPREFKIASHTYTIKFDSKALISAGGSAALVRHLYKEILLEKTLPPSELSQSFLHEFIHCIERFWVIKIDDADVDRLAEGLAVLLFDILGMEFDWSNISKSNT